VTSPFNIEIVPRGTSLVLIVEGELDITTAPLLDDELVEAEASGAPSIFVDLVRLQFIDSSGLHVLIKHAGSGSNPHRVRLTEVSPQVQRLFELTGTLDLLSFEPERPDPHLSASA
jgi:anti-sigma B factor antagonist